MTDDEDIQLEKAKAALPKATPGPWRAGRPDMATLVDGVDSKWIYAGDQYLAVASGRVNGPWEEVIANSRILAAAPVALRRVIELEAELARFKEWQKKALPHIQRRYYEDESQVQTVEFELPEWEKSPGYRAVVQACKERLPELSWLINQAQEGGRE